MIRWRRHHFEIKVAAVMSLVATLGLLVLGAMDVWVARQRALREVALVQSAQAHELASAVRFTLMNVRHQLDAVTALPWEISAWFGAAERRAEFQRLLKIMPAVDTVELLDRNEHVLMRVSRRDPDVWGDEAAQAKPSLGARGEPSRVATKVAQVELADGFDPTLNIHLESRQADAQSVRLQINLRRLSEGLGTALSPTDRVVYAADAVGRVVLHRDPGVLVRGVSIANLPHFAVAASANGSAIDSTGIDGAAVLATAADIGVLGLRAYVEQPRSAALLPVRDAIVRTAALSLIWLVLVLALGLYLARRVTRPIRALTAGAAGLARGDLDTRIQIDAHDELGDLAERFNAMASTLQDTITHQEQRIAEKTQALERANRNKTEFLANMSHELRTPLASVIGMAELLRSEPKHCGALNSQQDTYLRHIYEAGLHLESLVNDLLDLNKAEAGHMDIEPMECDIAPTAKRCLVFVSQAALRRRLQLSVSVEPANLLWRADPRRLKQILTNLLANAVKFTEAGSVSLSARVEDDELWIEVCDTGRGIAPEHLPHLCEPFWQIPGDAASSEDRSIQGTGLGLSLVRRLTELHGGTLEWESELGVGSVFRVRLPKEGPP